MNARTMARVNSAVLTWQNEYSIEFLTVIRRHHVYKAVWAPVLGEVLICSKDGGEDARKYDDNAIGTNKVSNVHGTESMQLVGYLPIKSVLFY